MSAVRHRGGANAAGRWLLSALGQRLASAPPPQNAFSESTWAAVRQKVQSILSLTTPMTNQLEMLK